MEDLRKFGFGVVRAGISQPAVNGLEWCYLMYQCL